ncbi:bifunctional 5,10-methylenetetrahydrofolate dehydrogenase/5,10-methenyltetrahydrofolate cyclohydrolase [Alicyclobacillus sp. ALC3]|uniref:bifunctional 5,10-methylenetetrahydrofolate dehydrogenase/5,10-methenyltetrahydrofolate cyclohydrolase n=1 Tax=Alicyclobacillus sp. ALC3 TaxID=2796143 RepID=UPI00237805AE|nr:tetrahydrofolate dehydrogenase/cyclohydrolase catalytic domain-containing protein [Alicyclobacillus sp. ALC3]WDL97171.1 bifunctional 5,10-methylene-tetrahydrofolate dehydrogenase/5,10-methylene-tetrahydrofolate cyclohydrolase [Alicyclobacillus sp. ALC3]
MEPTILRGKPVVQEIEANLSERVKRLLAKGITPYLATILVGDDEASATYVRMKGRACERNQLESRRIHLPETVDTAALIDVIKNLNDDSAVHGILLQHPVPSHIDERAAFEAIVPQKDVDGVTSWGFGRMSLGLRSHHSCTPEAVLNILDHYEVPIKRKRAVVLGRSPILGKPVSMLLLNRDATVTTCHSHTENIDEIVREADILVAAVGKSRFVQGSWIKPGAVIIDAGYSENMGDVDYAACREVVSAITPVPGGVGPVTIANLLRNTVAAAEQMLLR